jgi:hypothetical protein
VPLFCLFASIWASLFVEYWSRKSAALAHRWEMAEFEARETELQSYVEAEERQTGEAAYGFFEAGGGWVDMQDYVDKLKDKRLLKFVPKSHQDAPGVFPDWCCCLCGERGRRLNQIVSHFLRSFVSLAVINTMIAIVIAVVISLIVLRIVMGSGTYGGIAAAVIQSVAIIVLDAVYLKLAIWMTDFENKRTPTLYEDSMIVKIFLFQFVNAYFSLFYIAFVKSRFNTVFGFVTGLCVDSAGSPVTVVNSDGLSVNNCMPELTTQLTSIMITRMIVGNLTKNILPFLMYKFRNWQQARANRSKLAEEHPEWSEEQVQAEVESSGLRIRDIPQVEAEYNKDIYETVPNCAGTFNDFNTLLIQYGYVVLFAPAFPLAAFLALMSNVIEDYSNGFKLLFSVRRPRYSGAADIGSWFSLFAIISHLAVFTNAAIIVFTSTQMSRVMPGSTLFAQFAVVMAVEHVILMLKWAIARFTPEAPEWVRIRVARIDRIHSIMSEALEEEEAAKAAEEKRRLMMGGGGGGAQA